VLLRRLAREWGGRGPASEAEPDRPPAQPEGARRVPQLRRKIPQLLPSFATLAARVRAALAEPPRAEPGSDCAGPALAQPAFTTQLRAALLAAAHEVQSTESAAGRP